MTAMLTAEALTLDRRLSPVALSSAGGETVALVGPNGAGKTSLLRALARVEGAGGRVTIEGEDVDRVGEVRRRRLLSFLPASREVAWPIPVRDIVALGLADPNPRRVDELLDQFELSPFAERSIGSLSTGERSRVLLARAIATKPRLLLLDEPLSNLDPYWVLRTLVVLEGLSRAGCIIFVALHDLTLIDRFDRMLLLERGKVIADGQPAALRDRLATLFGVERSPMGGWRLPD